MRHFQKAVAFSFSMAATNGLYALCDTEDDEFYKSSWPIKCYAWLFEHSIEQVQLIILAPVRLLLYTLIKIADRSGLDWIGAAGLPMLLMATFAMWIITGYAVARWGGKVLNLIVAGVCVAVPIVGIALFAVDASIPFQTLHPPSVTLRSDYVPRP